MRMPRLLRFVTVVAALTVSGLAVAACGDGTGPDGAAGSSGPGSASAAPSTSSAPPQTSSSPTDGKVMPGHATQVIVTKSGGFAGLSQRVVIAEDGSWTYTDDRANTTENGKLPADKLTSLQQLATAEGLFTPDKKEGLHRDCADMFTYGVTVGDMTTQSDNCGRGPNETFDKLVAVVKDSTPLK